MNRLVVPNMPARPIKSNRNLTLGGSAGSSLHTSGCPSLPEYFSNRAAAAAAAAPTSGSGTLCPPPPPPPPQSPRGRQHPSPISPISTNMGRPRATIPIYSVANSTSTTTTTTSNSSTSANDRTLGNTAYLEQLLENRLESYGTGPWRVSRQPRIQNQSSPLPGPSSSCIQVTTPNNTTVTGIMTQPRNTAQLPSTETSNEGQEAPNDNAQTDLPNLQGSQGEDAATTPSEEDGEWYEHNEQKWEAYERYNSNNQRMIAILDDAVANCRPVVVSVTRVDSLRHQVKLLGTELVKQRVEVKVEKRDRENDMISFKESTALYHLEYAKLCEPISENTYNDMVDRFYTEMKQETYEQQIMTGAGSVRATINVQTCTTYEIKTEPLTPPAAQTPLNMDNNDCIIQAVYPGMNETISRHQEGSQTYYPQQRHVENSNPYVPIQEGFGYIQQPPMRDQFLPAQQQYPQNQATPQQYEQMVNTGYNASNNNDGSVIAAYGQQQQFPMMMTGQAQEPTLPPPTPFQDYHFPTPPVVQQRQPQPYEQQLFIQIPPETSPYGWMEPSVPKMESYQMQSYQESAQAMAPFQGNTFQAPPYNGPIHGQQMQGASYPPLEFYPPSFQETSFQPPRHPSQQYDARFSHNPPRNYGGMQQHQGQGSMNIQQNFQQQQQQQQEMMMNVDPMQGAPGNNKPYWRGSIERPRFHPYQHQRPNQMQKPSSRNQASYGQHLQNNLLVPAPPRPTLRASRAKNTSKSDPNGYYNLQKISTGFDLPADFPAHVKHEGSHSFLLSGGGLVEVVKPPPPPSATITSAVAAALGSGTTLVSGSYGVVVGDNNTSCGEVERSMVADEKPRQEQNVGGTGAVPSNRPGVIRGPGTSVIVDGRKRRSEEDPNSSANITLASILGSPCLHNSGERRTALEAIDKAWHDVKAETQDDSSSPGEMETSFRAPNGSCDDEPAMKKPK